MDRPQRNRDRGQLEARICRGKLPHRDGPGHTGQPAHLRGHRIGAEWWWRWGGWWWRWRWRTAPNNHIRRFQHGRRLVRNVICAISGVVRFLRAPANVADLPKQSVSARGEDRSQVARSERYSHHRRQSRHCRHHERQRADAGRSTQLPPSGQRHHAV